jgi:hypothetical protein
MPRPRNSPGNIVRVLGEAKRGSFNSLSFYIKTAKSA